MRSVSATLTVNVDVEDDSTDEQIQDDARGVMIDLLQSGCDIVVKPENTWTFYGHWEGSHIEVEYYVDGIVADERADTGYHEGGLWAAHGSGATVEEAQASTVAEYEDSEEDD